MLGLFQHVTTPRDFTPSTSSDTVGLSGNEVCASIADFRVYSSKAVKSNIEQLQDICTASPHVRRVVEMACGDCSGVILALVQLARIDLSLVDRDWRLY